jgi:hypothetical protein
MNRTVWIRGCLNAAIPRSGARAQERARQGRDGLIGMYGPLKSQDGLPARRPGDDADGVAEPRRAAGGALRVVPCTPCCTPDPTGTPPNFSSSLPCLDLKVVGGTGLEPVTSCMSSDLKADGFGMSYRSWRKTGPRTRLFQPIRAAKPIRTRTEIRTGSADSFALVSQLLLPGRPLGRRLAPPSADISRWRSASPCLRDSRPLRSDSWPCRRERALGSP